jgi:hypothetical protein
MRKYHSDPLGYYRNPSRSEISRDLVQSTFVTSSGRGKSHLKSDGTISVMQNVKLTHSTPRREETFHALGNQIDATPLKLKAFDVPIKPIITLTRRPRTTFSARTITCVSSRSSSRSTSWALSETPRFSDHKKTNTPGPGAYKTEDFSHSKKCMSSSFASNTPRSSPPSVRNLSPGPGFYETRPSRILPSGFSIPKSVREVSNRVIKPTSQSPGPAYYPPQRGLSKIRTKNLAAKVGCMSFSVVAPRFKYSSQGKNFQDVREKFYMYFRKPAICAR